MKKVNESLRHLLFIRRAIILHPQNWPSNLTYLYIHLIIILLIHPPISLKFPHAHFSFFSLTLTFFFLFPSTSFFPKTNLRRKSSSLKFILNHALEKSNIFTYILLESYNTLHEYDGDECLKYTSRNEICNSRNKGQIRINSLNQFRLNSWNQIRPLSSERTRRWNH